MSLLQHECGIHTNRVRYGWCLRDWSPFSWRAAQTAIGKIQKHVLPKGAPKLARA